MDFLKWGTKDTLCGKDFVLCLPFSPQKKLLYDAIDAPFFGGKILFKTSTSRVPCCRNLVIIPVIKDIAMWETYSKAGDIFMLLGSQSWQGRIVGCSKNHY